jgi:hypothetical protein
MTFRTVVKDGLIVINTHGEIPDGTPVEVVLSSNRTGGEKGTRRSKSKAPTVPEFGFGMWEHRKDIKDAAEFARELRVRTSRRVRRG